MKRKAFNLGLKRWQKILLYSLLSLIIWSGLCLAFNLWVRLPNNATKPVDAILVLGGSIKREIKAAKLSSVYDWPILISQGSTDPCIWFIFKREQARFKGVFLEKCADSTFGNYFFSVPILRRWGVHKVLLITSTSHLPRAELLAKILLGSQGIAYQLDLVEEKGNPEHQESKVKTLLDVTRSLLWAPLAQLIQPPCYSFIELSQVNIDSWRKKKFNCESQGNLDKEIQQYFQSPPNPL